jgi:hypothetical protein
MLGRMTRPLLPLLALLIAGCAGAPGSPAPTLLTADAVPPAQARPVFAAFAWNAGDVMNRWKTGTLWRLLEAKKLNGLLLGFTDADIARYSSAQGTATMNRFIAEAGAHGVRVGLLLGDPNWILPAGISSLKRILHRLRHVTFAEVNLDLEPNQVRGLPQRTVFNDLVAAMSAYISASPWPVTLDVNYIYANPAATHGYCLLCRLGSAGLRSIVLMTYVSRPQVVNAVDRPILTRFSHMRFTIGQSVEPPSVLPPQDSYWSDGFARFFLEMQKLNYLLSTHPNDGGITVESLQYLETMQP